MPNHELTNKLLGMLDFPLAAPSANTFGSISPTTAEHVRQYFEGELPMILDGGSCQRGIESTIIGFKNNDPVVYRLGSLPIEEIEQVIGPITIRNKKESAPDAPGMLSRHYAPTTKTYLVEDIHAFLKEYPNRKIGAILHAENSHYPQISHIEKFSIEGDMKEAASRLYSALHRMDNLGLDLIVAERFPDIGLGKTINDRLERATKPN